jgi:hypothetical protein
MKMFAAKSASILTITLLIIMGIGQMTQLDIIPGGNDIMSVGLFITILNVIIMWNFGTAPDCWTMRTVGVFFILTMAIGAAFLIYCDEISGLPFLTAASVLKQVLSAAGGMLLWGVLLTPFRITKRRALAAA